MALPALARISDTPGWRMNIAVLVRLARSTDWSSAAGAPWSARTPEIRATGRSPAAAAAGGGPTMRGVGGVEADQGLEHQGGHRVGHGDQPQHHPDRAGDLGDAAVVGRAGADPR